MLFLMFHIWNKNCSWVWMENDLVYKRSENLQNSEINYRSQRCVDSGQFYLYSPQSQITNLPQRALQSVQHTTTSTFRPLKKTQKFNLQVKKNKHITLHYIFLVFMFVSPPDVSIDRASQCTTGHEVRGGRKTEGKTEVTVASLDNSSEKYLILSINTKHFIH